VDFIWFNDDSVMIQWTTTFRRKSWLSRQISAVPDICCIVTWRLVKSVGREFYPVVGPTMAMSEHQRQTCRRTVLVTLLAPLPLSFKVLLSCSTSQDSKTPTGMNTKVEHFYMRALSWEALSFHSALQKSLMGTMLHKKVASPLDHNP